MKHKIGIFLFTIFALSTLVSAADCNPDSGFDWCWGDSNTYGDATARVELQGTYPMCDGEIYGISCTENWYVRLKGDADKLTLNRGFTSWDSLGNYENCDETGCNGQQTLSSGTNIVTLTDSNGQTPGFTVTGFDYAESGDDWSWVATSYGWLVGDMGYRTVECIVGDYYCEGTAEVRCMTNFEWEFFGRTPGNRCGFDCMQDSDCGGEEFVRVGCLGNDIVIESTLPQCSGDADGNCLARIPKTDVQETCVYGCQEIEGVPSCKEQGSDPDPGNETNPGNEDPLIKVNAPVIVGVGIGMILLVVGLIAFLAKKK